MLYILWVSNCRMQKRRKYGGSHTIANKIIEKGFPPNYISFSDNGAFNRINDRTCCSIQLCSSCLRGLPTPRQALFRVVDRGGWENQLKSS